MNHHQEVLVLKYKNDLLELLLIFNHLVFVVLDLKMLINHFQIVDTNVVIEQHFVHLYQLLVLNYFSLQYLLILLYNHEG
jgi:hypothetical protein